MRDVCDGVRLLELFVGGCQTIGNRSLRTGAATTAFATTASFGRRLAQHIEELGIRRLARRLPISRDGAGGFRRGLLVGGDHADKISVSHNLNAGDGFGSLGFGRNQSGIESRRPHDLSVKHPFALDIRSVLMLSGNEVSGIHFQR